MVKFRHVSIPFCFFHITLINFSYSNHPVICEDGILSVFLIEPAFEEWRKHTTVSLDEEAMSKRVDHVEEMAIPSDLEDKLQ